MYYDKVSHFSYTLSNGSNLALPEMNSIVDGPQADSPPLPWAISAGLRTGSNGSNTHGSRSEDDLAARLMQELRDKDSMLTVALQVWGVYGGSTIVLNPYI